MPPPVHLGEFEHLVLLAILRLGAQAHGAAIGGELEARAQRRVSRGALYTTLDRLEDKGLVRWKIAPGGDERAHLPRRVYTATARGVGAVRAAQHAVRQLSRGLDAVLKEPY